MAGLISQRKPLFEETASLFTDEKTANCRAKIIEWLNEAALADKNGKCELLAKIQELALSNADPELLDEFINDVLAFSQDCAADVRRAVIGFVEGVCKAHIKFLPHVINVMVMLLRDDSPAVQKRVIQACGLIYKEALKWICSDGVEITDSVESAWNNLCNMKAQIVDMIDHDNDGIRTNAIKCLEGVIILQTFPDDDSMKREDDFSLEDVPMNLKIVKRRKLEDEAMNIFEILIKFHAASHISSVNLIACTGTLCTIAKLRPSLMTNVIEALNKLNSNLPPTLTDSQVSSVRKHLKMQLLNILRQPASYELQSTIIQILNDVGATHQEIGRAIPRLSKQEQQKRAKRALENAALSGNIMKKARLEDNSSGPTKAPIEMEVDQEELGEQLAKSNQQNEEFIAAELRNVEQVIALVIHFMAYLPDTMPHHFVENYAKPMVKSDAELGQGVAKLLAEQMTERRLGPGVIHISKEPPMRAKVSIEEEKSIVHGLRQEKMDQDNEEDGAEEDDDGDDALRKEEATKKLREHLEKLKGDQIIPKMKERVKTLKIHEITKPLPKDLKERFLVDAVKRILRAEKVAVVGGVSSQFKRILMVFGSSFTAPVRQLITSFIFEDIRLRIDLAFSWLFEEYSISQGFSRYSFVKSEKKVAQDETNSYNALLLELIRNTLQLDGDREKAQLLRKVYLEAPLLTAEAMNELIGISERADLGGLDLVRELLILRPPKRLLLLAILLKFAVHSNNELRKMAQESILKVYEAHIMNLEIEDYALKWLNFLELAAPPEEIFHNDYGRGECIYAWTEDLAKVCLGLFIIVLPHKDQLVSDLCRVYTATTSDMKRTILRAIELPVRAMGAENRELLKLIEQCPKGGETLITRIVYILTEKDAPTPELVERVRDLYQNKVSDVRFLIPVLSALSKQEILTALPKFLKLSDGVVKDVIKRLLGTTSGQEYSPTTMPITPAELLVALHKLEPPKVELKLIMPATTLCLTEKEVFTHEVLAVVLQQLVELAPLPTLLMRTVIQSLTLYPRLGGFVTNLLQRLILKQVWKQKVVWEGFLKCSQRLQPQSLPVLIQLPSVQLQDALKICPDLKEPLLEHAKTLVEVGSLPKVVMDILEGKKDEGSNGQPLPPGEE